MSRACDRNSRPVPAKQMINAREVGARLLGLPGSYAYRAEIVGLSGENRATAVPAARSVCARTLLAARGSLRPAVNWR